MKKRSCSRIKAFDIFLALFMLFMIFITAYPVYYVLVASISDPGLLSRNTSALWAPLQPITFEAYRMVLADDSIISGFFNTVFILVFGLLFNMVMTSLGAFFLALKGPMLKNVVAMMIIFTMYFSGGMIPSYLNIRELGLLDSLWALIIPASINTTNLIILKSAFQSIPDSLLESAHLDGASYFKILTRIMIPLSKATLAVLVLYYGVAHWNSWFSASIYLRDSQKFPLQLVMRNILMISSDALMNGVDIGDMAQYAEMIKYAMIIVGTVPIMLVYPFLQKYFVKGVMIGAVKG